jgi:shikimate dehydrogenase/3-dehydroquinate dehydratase type I
MSTSLLCETVTGPTMRALIEARDRSVADMVEVRLDGAADPDPAGAVGGRRVPVVVTCRAAWEGGAFRGSEDERRRILSGALEAGAEHVDVEWRAGFDDVITAAPERVVVSSHDFEGMPSDLPAQARAMRATGAGWIKVAVTPRGLADTLSLADIGRAGRAVVVGMGAAGLPTRLLASWYGSAWSYAGDGVAPGQVPARRMLDEFRFREAPGAAVYGVLGESAEHSLSPVMHNAALAEAGERAVYLPLVASDFADFETFAAAVGLAGASVTIPFKRDALRAAPEGDEAATAIGAANTLGRGPRGWKATNTDAAGFLAPLGDALPGGLRGRRAAVLGAGGSARAAVHALVASGAAVTVHARRPAAAEALAAELGATAGGEVPEPGAWDVLVNATPLGGATAADVSPLPGGPFGGRLVYDLTYRADGAVSPLLREAAAAGCAVLDGLPMLVAQAERQFEWWLGRPPRRGVMQKAIETRLGRAVATRSTAR